MRFTDLVVDPGGEDHIARHGVQLEEVEEEMVGRPLFLRAREGRYSAIGQTDAGRYLTVFLAPRGQSVFSLITARDADRSERRKYQLQRRR